MLIVGETVGEERGGIWEPWNSLFSDPFYVNLKLL